MVGVDGRDPRKAKGPRWYEQQGPFWRSVLVTLPIDPAFRPIPLTSSPSQRPTASDRNQNSRVWIFSPTDPVLPEEDVREFYAFGRWPRKGFGLIFGEISTIGVLSTSLTPVLHRARPRFPQDWENLVDDPRRGPLSDHRAAASSAPKRRRALVSMSHKGPSFDRSGDAPIDTLRFRPRPPITRLPRRIAPPSGPSSPSCPVPPKENVREVLCPRIGVAQGFPRTFFEFHRRVACRPQNVGFSSTERCFPCTGSSVSCGQPGRPRKPRQPRADAGRHRAARRSAPRPEGPQGWCRPAPRSPGSRSP